MAPVITFKAVAMVFLVAVFSAAVSTVSAQNSEMSPSPSPDVGAAYSTAMSGAVICSSLVLSMLALLKH